MGFTINMKKIQLVLGTLCILILTVTTIIATNEVNQTGKIMEGDLIGDDPIFWDEANCSEQLELCIEQYNSLLYDFRNKTNCGGQALNMLRNMNAQLGEERDICNEELDKVNNYKAGFYFMFSVLIITGIVLIISSFKKE